MLKYSILTHHLEYNEFLNKLYELGVVHIIEKNKDEVDSYHKNKLNLQVFEKTIRKIAEKRNITEKTKTGIQADFDFLGFIREMEEKLADLDKTKSNIQKELNLYSLWENFDAENIKKLNTLGITVRFYSISITSFKEEWKEAYPIEVINNDGTRLYFIHVSHGENLEIPAKEIEMPVRPVAELNKVLKELESEISEINHDIDVHIAHALSILNHLVEKENRDLDFFHANANSIKLSDNKVILLEGWVPKNLVEKLNAYLDKKDIVYFAENPEKEDKVPVLLKNNNFSKLFEPIGQLFSLPAYSEIDLTPFFAPFFMLFFGFCVGDTGYGLLMVIATLALRFKVSKQLKPILSLATYLGISTIIMGLISGTFFGLNLVDLEIYPLKQIILEPLNLF
ncbi:MAG: hypothetical protein JXB17_08290, partial [Bacteroidales bacterium]|nr:hypothetical protein [Bacteroidales bacterium]